MALTPVRDAGLTLPDVIDRILDKGLVINADIQVSLVGVELLGIRVRAVLASLETAARFGLELPGGTALDAPGLREAREGRETCPGCGKRSSAETLLGEGCPWCGWRSARALRRQGAAEETVPAAVIEALVAGRPAPGGEV